MDFRLAPEEKMILETVRDFIRTELTPLEGAQQEAHLAGRGHEFPDEPTTRRLQHKAKDLGLWGIATPKEYGGADLSTVLNAMIAMEMGRCLVSFQFPGRADNILFLANDRQKERYLIPTLEGERLSCFALT